MLTITNVIPLVPTVDGVFLPDDPLELLKSQKFKKCPVMLGTTQDDGSLIAIRAYLDQLLNDDPYANKTVFRENLEKYTYTYKNDIIVDAMIQEYIDWTLADDPETNYFFDYIDVITDEAFACPADGWARAYADSGQDVYLYQYTHLPNQTTWSEFAPNWIGVAHSEDMQFFFGYYYNPNMEDFKNMPQEEIDMTVDTMRFYANFAKTG